MNWEAVGAIGEVGGAIAVVVTLVYLAIQVQQANSNSQKVALTEIITLYQHHSAVVASDDNAEAFLKGLRDYAGLTAIERVKFNMCIAGHMNVIDTILTYAWSAEGKDETEAPFALDYYGARLFAYPGFRDWWHHTEQGAWIPKTIALVNRGIEVYRGSRGFWEGPEEGDSPPD